MFYPTKLGAAEFQDKARQQRKRARSGALQSAQEQLHEQQPTGVIEFGILLRALSEEFDQPEKALFNGNINHMGGKVEFALASEGEDHSTGTPRFALILDEEGLEGPEQVAQLAAQPTGVVEEI